MKKNKTSASAGKRVLLLIAVMLSAVTMISGQWTIDEGFEGGIIPADWTIYDVNEDGHQWVALENTTHAHSGDWIAAVDCYDSDGEDWLITPQVTIQSGDSFIFFAKAWFGSEDFNVKLSTTGNAINDFNVTLESVTGLGDDYVEFEYDLSPYAGEVIYLAIEWIQDTYALVVDDVKVGQAEPNDAGMLSIEIPESHHFLNSEIIPSGTIMNYGTSEITDDFNVTCEIVDALDVIVYNSTFVHSGSLLPEATEVVTFPDTWIADEIGIFYVTMSTDLGDDANPNNDSITEETEIFQHYGIGGPDAFGYQWIDSTEEGGPVYDWIEISETGSSAITYGVPGFYGDDNFSEPIEFGFDFPFYGIERTYFHVDINGEFLLTENTWYHEYPDPYGIWQTDGNMFNYVYPIPGYTQMPALIAIYWDDLHADEGIGDIYFQTFGTAPNRYCVVEWHNVRFHNGTGGTPNLCFETIFHENGDMVFQYQNVATGQTDTICPQDYGQSSTIAIQNDTADIGLCYLREIVENGQYLGIEPHGNMLQNELAISFFMGEDHQPPAFVYDEMGNTFDNTPEISLTITDMHPILSDTLYYDIGSGWEGISHTNFEEPNIYYYQLPEIPNSTTVNYYFAATDDSPAQNRGTLPANAPQETYTFMILPTDGIDVLLAYSGSQDWQNLEYPKYIMALDNANISYDIYNWEEFDYYAFPDCYKAIFAYGRSFGHGDEEDTFSATLMNFLDYGTNDDPKNLFMAADDIANNAYSLYSFQLYDRPLTKFYYAYLRGGHIPTGYGGGTDGIGGPDIYDYSDGSILITNESVIGSANQELQTYSNSPDVLDVRACPEIYQNEVLNPEISSITAFIFEDGPINGQAYAYHNTCALSLDNLIYKSFFTSFDLSQFTNDDDINMIISDALDWFGIEPTGTEDPEINVPANFLLAQNYPNPFNPTTTISFFNGENTEHTEIVIYNVKGQKITTLIDEKLDAGTHQVVWNGKDGNGKPVASGIYFYKMKVGKYTSVKRMILMK